MAENNKMVLGYDVCLFDIGILKFGGYETIC